MTYAEAFDYLNTFLNWETTPLNATLPKHFNLERMTRLLDAMGNPHESLTVVHVAGTKGKGSTCAFIERALRETGLSTGLYAQPHLISPRERMIVSGRCVTELEFADLTRRFQPILEAHRETGSGRLTFFEIYTAMAFAHFAERQVDVAVIEVGIGGRLDATNVVSPRVSVIAPIGFDHLLALGSTLGKIALEKAGIIKHCCPVVVAPQTPEAMKVIRQVADEKNAPLIDASEIPTERLGIVNERERCHLGEFQGLRLRSLGAHQVSNAATALASLRVIQPDFPSLTDDAIRRGLEAARMHGRFQMSREICGDGSLRSIVLDAAHTGESAASLRQTLREVFPDEAIHFVVGMASDKDARRFAEALAPVAAEARLTRTPNNARAADPDALEEAWRSVGVKATQVPTVQDAFAQIFSEPIPGRVVCVTGSVHFIGYALETAMPNALNEFRREVNL